MEEIDHAAEFNATIQDNIRPYATGITIVGLDEARALQRGERVERVEEARRLLAGFTPPKTMPDVDVRHEVFKAHGTLSSIGRRFGISSDAVRACLREFGRDDPMLQKRHRPGR